MFLAFPVGRFVLLVGFFHIILTFDEFLGFFMSGLGGKATVSLMPFVLDFTGKFIDSFLMSFW